MKIISGQRFLDTDIVAEKQAAKDYIVKISPAFEFDGQEYAVLMDGHHSFAAAKADGIEPVYVEATVRDADTIQLLIDGNLEDFLVTQRQDDFYDVVTGKDEWA